jgi:hypothetical protein
MRNSTRSLARSTIVAILTALAALIIGVMQSLTTAVTASIGLTAVQALIVPGTGTPDPSDVKNYMQNARDYYLIPGGDCPNVGQCKLVPVPYIAQFWPIPLPGWGGLQGAKWNVSVASGVASLNDAYADALETDDDIVIFGYSQGATVASNFKREHADDDPEVLARTDYFFIGNPQKANGGFFERFAFLGNVPILDAQFGDPTPTDTCTDENGALRTCATDFALQYDGVVDFPQWLLNPLAILNAAAGFEYVHGTYLSPKGTDPKTETPYGYSVEEVQHYVEAASAPGGCTPENFCQHVEGSDTNFIVLPARYLPIYQPFIDVGDATGTSAIIVPITDLLSPATQTLIETGYNRTDYSQPTPASILPPANFNPIQVGIDLINDVPEGINMALEPGRTPLPGSPPPLDTTSTTTTTTTVASTNEEVAPTTKPYDGKPLVRLGLIARPGEGIATGTDGSTSDRPLRNALNDFHPVRDVVNTVSSSVQKALGTENNSAASGDTDSEG